MSVYRDTRHVGRWTAKFVLDGKQHIKRNLPTRQAAQRWETEERRRLKDPNPETDSISFVSLADRYLDHCSARMQHNTVRYKATHFARFLAWLNGDHQAGDIQRSQASDYILGVASVAGNKQANRALRDLHALYSWGMDHDHVAKNPFHGIAKFPEEPFLKYVPPSRDIEAVILAADHDETDLLETLYYTGARISEILKATWDEVNFEKSTLVLRTRKRRGGQLQSDTIPIPEALCKTLKGRFDRNGRASGMLFSIGNYHKRHLMHRLCDRAGVPHFGYHAIRHHVASIVMDSGKATLRQIQQFLRHRRPTTTEAYLQDVTRDQREIVEILEKERAKNG
jgi:integrase